MNNHSELFRDEYIFICVSVIIDSIASATHQNNVGDDIFMIYFEFVLDSHITNRFVTFLNNTPFL